MKTCNGMWYCSLCDLNLGEISADSNKNNQPTCPYCHGAVEEENKHVDKSPKVNVVENMGTTRNMDDNDVLPGTRSNNPPKDFSDKVAEPIVDCLFNIIAMSLEESVYGEFGEDVIQIVKAAFEPKANIAYREIAKIVTETYKNLDAEFDDLEESFDEDGVALAKALSDVAVAIGDLNERLGKIERTICSIEKQARLQNPKLCKKEETQWQEM